MPTVHRTPSRDLESVLMRAADAVLRREGLDRVSVRSVAAEAGVAPMGLYSRFGSKEGLVNALLVQAIGDLQRAVFSEGEPDPGQRLRRAAHQCRHWALANPQHYEAIFLNRHGIRSAEASAHFAALYELGVSMHEYAIARGVLQQVDPRASCARFWCAIHGAITFELHRVILPKDADSNFDAVLTMVLRGLS